MREQSNNIYCSSFSIDKIFWNVLFCRVRGRRFWKFRNPFSVNIRSTKQARKLHKLLINLPWQKGRWKKNLDENLGSGTWDERKISRTDKTNATRRRKKLTWAFIVVGVCDAVIFIQTVSAGNIFCVILGSSSAYFATSTFKNLAMANSNKGHFISSVYHSRLIRVNHGPNVCLFAQLRKNR